MKPSTDRRKLIPWLREEGEIMSYVTEMSDDQLLKTVLYSAYAGIEHEELLGFCVAELHMRLNNLRSDLKHSQQQHDATILKMKGFLEKALSHGAVIRD